MLLAVVLGWLEQAQQASVSTRWGNSERGCTVKMTSRRSAILTARSLVTMIAAGTHRLALMRKRSLRLFAEHNDSV